MYGEPKLMSLLENRFAAMMLFQFRVEKSNLINKKRTALDYAISKNHKKIITLLQKYGAKKAMEIKGDHIKNSGHTSGVDFLK